MIFSRVRKLYFSVPSSVLRFSLFFSSIVMMTSVSLSLNLYFVSKVAPYFLVSGPILLSILEVFLPGYVRVILYNFIYPAEPLISGQGRIFLGDLGGDGQEKDLVRVE